MHSEHPHAGPTLVIGLGRLGHVDGKLAAERVDTHHACVRGGIAQGGYLVVVPGDTVQCLGDVGRPFEDDLLEAATP